MLVSLLCSSIITSGLPFSVVENIEFVKLMSASNLHLTIPGRKTVQRRILAIQEFSRIKMKTILSNRTGSISLTADAWSSLILSGYMGITAHWIDYCWNLQKIVLDFHYYDTTHS